MTRKEIKKKILDLIYALETHLCIIDENPKKQIEIANSILNKIKQTAEKL